jgi:hypothetical protein
LVGDANAKEFWPITPAAPWRPEPAWDRRSRAGESARFCPEGRTIFSQGLCYVGAMRRRAAEERPELVAGFGGAEVVKRW